jgi:hypothetical protein
MSLADAPVGAEVDGLRVVAAPHVDVKRADADGSARAAVRDAAVRAPLLRIVTFEGTEAELRARLARLTDGFTVEGMLAAPLANNDNSNSSSSSRQQKHGRQCTQAAKASTCERR